LAVTPVDITIIRTSLLQQLFRRGRRYQTSRECHARFQTATENRRQSRHSSTAITPTGLSSGHLSAARIQQTEKFPIVMRQNLDSTIPVNQLNITTDKLYATKVTTDLKMTS